MTLPLLLILGALTAFGPLAIDFYLPSFPALAAAFGTDVEQVQLSLAAYFIGMTIGQLAYGPLADRLGRRLPLLFGVALFSLASLACALAGSLEQLIVARFAQALGGCAGMVVARTVVRDLCDPLTTAKVFSRLMLVMGLAPILAPLAGGLLLQAFGWQSIFLCLTLFGALTFLAVVLLLPETLVGDTPRPSCGEGFRHYFRLLRDREFMSFSLAGGVAMAGMFAYIAGSPFVFIELYGVPEEHYGWLFGSNAAGFILVSQLNARALHWRGPGFWLRRVIWLHAGSALVLLLVALARPATLWPLLPPLFVCIASLGAIMPNATACALAKQGAQAGSASALLGSLQFCMAALASALVGVLHDGSALPMAQVIGLCALIAAGVGWYSGQLDTRPR
ncbi:Drug resistance transporter Bcr/CflA subfamily [Azotobacter vinelandii CA]|uniref:Bcr/CflA family efflux transporter n=2 Tax=Azotobacter vinelandii TaxID=354 RepID=C1DNM5_AZOVD|nr:multidrug effflux MFS transporter [Azotobacter vinelandii]ACO77241.1 Drug resistance transporter Bcr/CflA subfamily [Azotobacter vinelandii DJ]AGK15435.1 Drug resistance transporter Bcr/CflA subfamily [Azotobacter vinelandii CA]AGK19661.1 Drug resistance transporter Bcr/CflA subfamily [Azotobacter vinelandii CA6]SFX63639.1 MFS transporter, DHA1 family, bicyclomycin/chloramphenicol resistance protein [Azotobacter vinelandii]GLK59818.1 Bcr/CflA family drug resistance efflux transporter [Azoto